MKKTIAILLVLVIAGVGLFAVENTTVALSNTTSILIKTEIFGVALFGVSADELDVTTDYADSTTFSNMISANITKDVDIADLEAGVSVGWISAFNSTSTPYEIAISIGKLVNQTVTSAEIDLLVSPTDNLKILAAGSTRYAMPSEEITVTSEDFTQIELATAGEYEATVTFTIVAG